MQKSREQDIQGWFVHTGIKHALVKAKLLRFEVLTLRQQIESSTFRFRPFVVRLVLVAK